jgi:hypothetical protein
MVDKSVFLFGDLAKGVLSEARYEKYAEWVQTSNEARQGSRRVGYSFERANQYDKAEELITWNTFAPLLKMDKETKDKTISNILAGGLDRDLSEYLDEVGFTVDFEREIPSPRSYLEHIQKAAVDHPVKYVREAAKGRSILEGKTHVDVVFENSKMLVLGEVKFMSDIACQVRYDPVRNQLARLIDVGLSSRRGKRLAVVIFAPEWGYNRKNRLYYYKVRDYRESPENIRADIPHRPIQELTDGLLGVGWIPLDRAASVIHKAAIDSGLEQKEGITSFYAERRIQLTISSEQISA